MTHALISLAASISSVCISFDGDRHPTTHRPHHPPQPQESEVSLDKTDGQIPSFSSILLFFVSLSFGAGQISRYHLPPLSLSLSRTEILRCSPDRPAPRRIISVRRPEPKVLNSGKEGRKGDSSRGREASEGTFAKRPSTSIRSRARNQIKLL